MFAVVVVLLVSFATACGSGARQQAASSSAGTILFNSASGCGQTVNGIRPDGTGLSRILRASSCTGNGVYFNEAGTRAIVLQPIGVGIGPYIVDLRSGKRVRVPVTGLADSIYPPNQPWSPNGKRLLLAVGSAYADNDTYIVYNPSTTHWVKVDVHTQDVPLWSADGKSVLFPTGHSIDAAGVTGGSKRLVSLPKGWDISSVEPSTDGKWISFLKQGLTSQLLYVVRRDGSGLRKIADEVAVANWSPTGERLVYENDDGIVVSSPTSRRTTVVARPPAVDPYGLGAALWSPDGRWILYAPKDLGSGAPTYGHQQLWAVRANGRGAHPVTNAFMGGTSLQATPVAWVSSDLHGASVQRPAFVESPAQPVLTTKLPIVALGVLKDEVAVSTGFGVRAGEGERQLRAPRGPIVQREPGGRVTRFQPSPPCPTVTSLTLTSTQLGYVCDTSRYEQGREALRIGGKEVVRTLGGQGIGSFLGGPATDGRTIAYSVALIPQPQPPKYTYRPGTTRVYERRGSSTTLVRTIPGWATLVSFADGRIALLKSGRRPTLIVLTPHGGTKTFRYPVEEYPSVALSGNRLVLLGGGHLTTIDIATGRRHVVRTELGSGVSTSALAGVRGDLVAYVLGATVHVVRLSDGREVVLDTPGATTPTLASFGASGLFYAYNEEYAKHPGRVGFITVKALEHAIATKGRPAR